MCSFFNITMLLHFFTVKLEFNHAKICFYSLLLDRLCENKVKLAPYYHWVNYTQQDGNNQFSSTIVSVDKAGILVILNIRFLIIFYKRYHVCLAKKNNYHFFLHLIFHILQVTTLNLSASPNLLSYNVYLHTQSISTLSPLSCISF